MDKLELIIDNLQRKIENFISLHAVQAEKNIKLEQQIAELQEIVEKQKEIIRNFDDKYQALKISKSLGSDEKTTIEYKQKLNAIIREVDKCISLLNN